MEIILHEKPKNPIVITGFPGIGMVGAIAAEFLIQHLGTKNIGKVLLDKSPPLVAIHEGKLIEPFGIYYSTRYNIVVVHSIVALPGAEWQIAEALLSICTTLRAKELISMEGVGSPADGQGGMFFYSNNAGKEKTLMKKDIKRLSEGIIMGPTSAILMKAETLPVSCLFASTHDAMPDSNAAALAIKAIDSYLGLKVDYKPLQQLAAKFEQKLRGIIEQSRLAEDLRDKKQMNYVG